MPPVYPKSVATRVAIDVTDPNVLSSSIGSVHDPLDEVLFHDSDTPYRRPATLLAVEEVGYRVEVSGGVRMLVRTASETVEWCRIVRGAIIASGQDPDRLKIAGYLEEDRWLPLDGPSVWRSQWDQAFRESQARSVIES